MMRVLIPVSSSTTDDELAFIRGMGITSVELYLKREETDSSSIKKIQDRLKKYGIRIELISCLELQKNKKIDLGLEGRDQEIEDFQKLVVAAAKNDIRVLSVAWQPNGIFRSGRKAGSHTRGCISGYVDMNEISKRAVLNGRVYGHDEIWNNFGYFLEKMTPVCHRHHVRLALHPNDPPVESLGGVCSLIKCSDDYRKAFEMDQDKILGMKLCIGCWLEGGDKFGNLHEDIDEFVKEDRVLCVHFRNVSNPLPQFEETLAEDGYADMYAIMKMLVSSGYQGTISADHVFDGHQSTGGALGQWAYATGYIKGLMKAAEEECKTGGKL